MSLNSASNQTDKSKAPWLFILVIVVLFFLVNSFLAYRSTQIINDNAVRIEHSLGIITLIRELQVQLFAAESGQRGYLITSDAQYLEPYHAAQARIADLLLTLEQETSDAPEQEDNFHRIQDLFQRKLEEMKRTVNYVDREKQSAAIRLTNTDRGLNLTREIMNLIHAVEHDERERLVANRVTARHNNTLILGALLTANAAGLILALVIYFVWLRYTRNIKQLYKEIEQANQELEKKVQERTNTLQKYAEELERSNRELQDFAFVASHDLQEPLRKIRAFGDRLLSKFGDALGEQGADYTRRMQAASERMSTLINDLLSFSRVTTQQKPFEVVDLSKLMAQVLEDLEYTIEQSQAQVSVDPLPHIMADDSQLRQVFSNLISNSIKFMPRDRTPRISVTCTTDPTSQTPAESTVRESAERIQLHFTDNGIGFEEQYRDRIFNLFQRLHSRDEYTGTGIGLALCRKIVERHGGSIEAHSTPGEGTTFSIDLPTQQTNLMTSELEPAI